MGLISTKELLDRYYDSLDSKSAKRSRAQIDKPELYYYENEIGKELIDMDVEDLYGLIFEFGNKRNGKEIQYLASHSSFDQITTILRSLFNFYIDNVQPIKNPLNDKRMRGMEAMKRLSKGRKSFDWGVVEDVIKRLHDDLEENRADYVELILLLFHDGFSTASEIVTVTENMIDHDNKTVMMPDRTIQLSDRCYELLVKFNQMDFIKNSRVGFALCSWHSSYFKFAVRRSNKDTIDGKPQSIMSDKINRCIIENVNNRYDIKINYRNLFFLGFYEYIVKKHGVEKTNEMLTSFRNAEHIAEITNLAKEYGVYGVNISHIKRSLVPYIASYSD